VNLWFFAGIYWYFYESFKKSVMLHKQIKELPVAWAFLCGASAGTIAGVATLPFDVVKTHRQIQLGQLISTQKASARKHSTHTLVLLGKLYREKGVTSLFSGVAPRIAKVAPSCAIMISSYEFFKTYFRRRNAMKAEDVVPVRSVNSRATDAVVYSIASNPPGSD
jgi:solute carrier family 25 protein 39/40